MRYQVVPLALVTFLSVVSAARKIETRVSIRDPDLLIDLLQLRHKKDGGTSQIIEDPKNRVLEAVDLRSLHRAPCLLLRLSRAWPMEDQAPEGPPLAAPRLGVQTPRGPRMEAPRVLKAPQLQTAHLLATQARRTPVVP